MSNQHSALSRQKLLTAEIAEDSQSSQRDLLIADCYFLSADAEC